MEYCGNLFEGDVLEDGQVRWKDTDYVFSTLSAWASHCKRIVNPEKKNACGWTTVKYNGRKMEWYKNKWLQLQQARSEAGSAVPAQVGKYTRTPILVNKHRECLGQRWCSLCLTSIGHRVYDYLC